MNKQQIYNDILKEYEFERDKNQSIHEARLAKLYNEAPEFKTADENLKKCGIELTRLAIRGGTKEELSILNDKIKAINDFKLNTLKKLGYGEDYLAPVYTCSKCKDTGYINNQKCACFQKKLIKKYYNLSNLNNVLAFENFDKFSLELYSDKPFEGEDLSPRENIRAIVTDIHAKLASPDPYFNYYFFGNPGLGKTFTCSCIAKAMLDKGYSVIYMTSHSLISLLEKRRFSSVDPQEENEAIDMLFSCDLLIIDDLGTEANTSVTMAEIFNIVNNRLINRKSVVISSNLRMSEINTLYSDRLASRIMGNYEICYFYGKDIRMKGL